MAAPVADAAAAAPLAASRVWHFRTDPLGHADGRGAWSQHGIRCRIGRRRRPPRRPWSRRYRFPPPT